MKEKFFHRNRIKACALIALVCLLLFSLTGCDRIKNIFSGSDEENKAPDIKEGTVLVVGDSQVSLAEWFLYVQPKIEEMEAVYGTQVWDYRLESIDKSLADALIAETVDRIAYIKTVCGQAEALSVSLNEDDMIDVNVSVEDYLLELQNIPASDREAIDRLGVGEELIRKVYSDNQLATKVYEHLTLNVDTDIDEDSVRYMNLQYISIPKYSVDANDVRQDLGEEELAEVKAFAEQVYRDIKDVDYVRLSDYEGDVNVSDLLLDYKGIEERLGSRIADEAFALKEGQFSELIETEDAYFILGCVSESDRDMTNRAKIRVIEQRQEAVFGESYKKWASETKVELIEKDTEKLLHF